jgi:hypothetical protein
MSFQMKVYTPQSAATTTATVLVHSCTSPDASQGGRRWRKGLRGSGVGSHTGWRQATGAAQGRLGQTEGVHHATDGSVSSGSVWIGSQGLQALGIRHHSGGQVGDGPSAAIAGRASQSRQQGIGALGRCALLPIEPGREGCKGCRKVAPISGWPQVWSLSQQGAGEAAS